MTNGYENAPATKMLAVYCACCSRPLVDAVSVETGVGPECRRRHGYADAQTAPDWFAVANAVTGVLRVDEVLGARCPASSDAMTAADIAGAVRTAESAWMIGGVETRRVANVIVHRIAADQNGPAVARLTNALRALGYARLADRIADRLATVRITAEGDNLYVEAPFDPAAVAAMRAVPGRWWERTRGRHGATRFPATSRAALHAALMRAYPGATATGPKGLFTLT